MRRSRFVIVLILLVGLAMLLSSQGQTAWANGTVTIEGQTTPPVDPALRRVVEQATREFLKRPPSGNVVISLISVVQQWAYGTIGITSATENSPDPQGLLFVAKQSSGEWQVAIEQTTLFRDFVTQAPNTLISPAQKAIIAPPIKVAGDGSAQLSLPWATGETWSLTGGPHKEGGVLGALDFAVLGGNGAVRAAGDGIAYVPCANKILIYYPDGWGSGYYHVSNIAINNGQSVSRGQYLGITSTGSGCGGTATGAHVHFWTQKNTTVQGISGQDIGGWTVSYTGPEYYGCMTRIKDGLRRCADVLTGSTYQDNKIYNDGAIGSGSAPCILKSVGDANCDGRVTLLDFEQFRQEFVRSVSTTNADFNNDGKVSLLDFEIWRSNYTARRSLNATARTTATSSQLGEASAIPVAFDNTRYSIRPDGAVELNIFFDAGAASKVSGGDISLSYSPDILQYDDTAADYTSPTCANSYPGGNYTFKNRVRVENDAAAGVLRIARVAVSGDDQLASGRFCAGTITFKPKSGVTSAVGTISFDTNALNWEIVGPQATLAPQFDSANSTATVEISAVNKPSNLTAIGSTKDSITLAWQDNSDNEDGFKIYRWDGGGAGEWKLWKTVGANTTRFVDTAVDCEAGYFYDVSAYNSNGESARAGWIQASTTACPGPAKPDNLAVSATTNNSISLTWQDNSNNEDGFKVYKWDGVAGDWRLLRSVGANVTQFVDTSLDCASDYYYQVSAYNRDGESKPTGFVKGTTGACSSTDPSPSPPSPPPPSPPSVPGSKVFLPFTIR